MSPKLKYHHVNWENGMKISKENFIQQDNVFQDKLKDVFAGLLNSKNFGLLPIDVQNGEAIKTMVKMDNQNFLKVNVFQCRGVTQGGGRVEILEEYLLPEFKIDISKELELASRGEGDTYYIMLSVDLFNREPFGELNAEEEPPRYPYSIPSYKINLISNNQIAKEGIHPYSIFIGKMELTKEIPEIFDDYIPPCMVINSSQVLITFLTSVEKFYSQLELNLLSIIQKIKEKGQDSSLAQTVLSLSENLLHFTTHNHLRLRWELPDSPPIFLFEYISTTARVIRNTIDSNSSSHKEELLNYFTNWSELKQGDFEKLLVYCINFDYHHYDILISVEQFSEFIQIISLLFDKLESLAYIGKKKETNIFVKEQKTKRSFLAD